MQPHDSLARLAKAHKTYGPLTALDGVDLDVRRGEVLALLGANGAGKSTAIGLLLGLLEPDRGAATLFGLRPQALAARRRIGVMLQSAGLPDHATVAELIELTRSYYAAPRSTADCVALAGLDGLLERRYLQLSGGQQRRVQFALALCGRPELLFLDEPTTGLDIEARQGLWRAIRELVDGGCAVLLTTHYLEEAEALADRVVMLARGRVVAAGRMDEVRAQIVQARIRVTSALDPVQIAAWPQVRDARRDGARLELVVDDADAVVRRLLAADPGCVDLEVQRAGLADAFVELTRDAAPALHQEAA
ncbi:ABC transporter ATP-binding protein [Cognatilysobacter bugurensis]|uniref:Multidrug ABC transporter ATP-binding protein n=1 Tax=Cognatilysobacter bugurensis TaxID=543356 RepID=A0A918W914_9GAMM|nr:ABC transporter ATP-binding protein [Lysobacter bugurensis]GHA82969.1 multidrug ABC transporter ATP-binding protein [Lysobacter bugurensis]